MCKNNNTNTEKTPPIKILFIGNSATYVHELPQTLSRLACEAGYEIEVSSITKGGYELRQHADSTTEHGERVLSEIARGYDIVFLQDNGNCISSDEKRTFAKDACKTLDAAIKKSGGRTFIYVRPPYGKDAFGRTAFEQCAEFDRLFCEIAEELCAQNAYVNRAFAYAIKNYDINLWGPDNAHTSECGGYLAVCVFFVTLFGVSASVLGFNGLASDDAKVLQEIADKVVLENFIPW